MSSSETHNQRNVNRSITESLEQLKPVFDRALSQGLEVRAYISTVFGCPYEGDVDFQRVIDIAGHLLDCGAFQISLGDTTGVGRPFQVQAGCKQIADAFDVSVSHITLYLTVALVVPDDEYNMRLLLNRDD